MLVLIEVSISAPVHLKFIEVQFIRQASAAQLAIHSEFSRGLKIPMLYSLFCVYQYLQLTRHAGNKKISHPEITLSEAMMHRGIRSFCGSIAS